MKFHHDRKKYVGKMCSNIQAVDFSLFFFYLYIQCCLHFSVAVVVAFFICWAPQHSQRLYSIYAQDNSHKKIYIIIYQAMNYTSGILYYLSTCINPFLYSIMSYKFREAFKVCILSYSRKQPFLFDPNTQIFFIAFISPGIWK